MSRESSIGKSIFGAAIAIGIAAYLFIFSGIGEKTMVQCQVNGLGDGHCQFTNTGWTVGTSCVEVSLKNFKNEVARSGTVCSGRVWPDDSVRREVSVIIPPGHCSSFSDSSWQENCDIIISENGSNLARLNPSSDPEGRPETSSPAIANGRTTEGSESSPDASSSLLEESLGFDRSKDNYLGKLNAVIVQLVRDGAIPRTPSLVFDDKTTFYVPSRNIEVFGSKLVALEHRYNMEYLGGPPVYGLSVLLDVKKDKYVVEGIARTYKCEVTPLKGSYSDMELFVNKKLPNLSTGSLLEMSCTTRV